MESAAIFIPSNTNPPTFDLKTYDTKTKEQSTNVIPLKNKNAIPLKNKNQKHALKKINIPNHFDENSKKLFLDYKIDHLLDDSLTIFNDGDNNLGIIKDNLSYSIALVFVGTKKVLFTIQSKSKYEPALASGKLVCSSKNINKNLLIERLYNLFNDILVRKND